MSIRRHGKSPPTPNIDQVYTSRQNAALQSKWSNGYLIDLIKILLRDHRVNS